MANNSSSVDWDENFKRLLSGIAKRPSVYVGCDSLKLVFCFINGYAAAVQDAGQTARLDGFADFIYAKHQVFHPMINFVDVIEAAYHQRAVGALPKIFDEFFEVRRKLSAEEIFHWRKSVIRERYGAEIGVPDDFASLMNHTCL